MNGSVRAIPVAATSYTSSFFPMDEENIYAVLLVSADDFQFMARVRMVQWIGCLLYIYIGDFAVSISFFL